MKLHNIIFFVLALIQSTISNYAQSRIEQTYIESNNFMKILCEEINSGGKISPPFVKNFLKVDTFAFNFFFKDKIDWSSSKGVFLLLEQSSWTCSRSYIFSLSNNGELVDKCELAKNCDMDLSFASYTSSEYRFINTLTIEIKTTINKAKDKSIVEDEGDWAGIILKPNYSFDEVEKTTTQIYKYLKLKENGLILRYKSYRAYPQASLRILDVKQLQEYTIEELHLMRNEIFADYGYVFTSKDLSEYFAKQSWYHPKVQDATTIFDKCSIIEKANIKIIKDVELKKVQKIN